MSRLIVGGIAHLAQAIERDLNARETGLRKPHRGSLSDLTACALTCRNVNSSEWMAVLPRQTGDEKSKERFISRVLSNRLIDPIKVMRGFVPELVSKLTLHGESLILMLDQSKISDGFECLMISALFNKRAVPVVWSVVETKGPIGFDSQEKLLNQVLTMIPKGIAILLSADRFYGTSSIIEWCIKAGWHYRIRLKSNLILNHDGGEISTGDAALMKLRSLENAKI